MERRFKQCRETTATPKSFEISTGYLPRLMVAVHKPTVKGLSSQIGHVWSQNTKPEESKQKVTACLVLITSLAVSWTQLCQEASWAYGHF